MMMAVKSWTMAWLVAAAILFLIARQAGECYDCYTTRSMEPVYDFEQSLLLQGRRRARLTR